MGLHSEIAQKPWKDRKKSFALTQKKLTPFKLHCARLEIAVQRTKANIFTLGEKQNWYTQQGCLNLILHFTSFECLFASMQSASLSQNSFLRIFVLVLTFVYAFKEMRMKRIRYYGLIFITFNFCKATWTNEHIRGYREPANEWIALGE